MAECGLGFVVAGCEMTDGGLGPGAWSLRHVGRQEVLAVPGVLESDYSDSAITVIALCIITAHPTW